MRRTLPLIALACLPACNHSVDVGAPDLRVPRLDDLGFGPEPDLASSVDLAELPDLALPPDLRLVPLALSFAAPVEYAVDHIPINLVAGDFNRDNNLDLALTTHASNGVSVLLGNGNGTFRAAATYPTGISDGIATGDFNGDGKLDLCSTGQGSPGWVHLLIGNGDGTFAVSSRFPGPGDPFGVAVGDFNGDKKLDVAAVQFQTPGLLVYPGNGDGTLGAYTVAAKAPRGQTIAAADLDRDGVLDLVVPEDDSVLVLHGDGKLGFSESARQPAGSFPIRLAATDLDGDGRTDVAVANYGGMPAAARVLLGTGNGFLSPAAVYPTMGRQSSAVAAADLDKDRILDLVVTDYLDGFVSVMSGLGNGAFNLPRRFPCGSTPRSVVSGDFNKDGRVDLAVTASGTDKVTVLLSTSR